MKTMYEYFYPVGCKVWENMPDEFPEGVPYTSVPPLPDIPLERQFWNPSERKWEEIITQDVSKKLSLLEEINKKHEKKIELIQEENQMLKNNNETLNTQLTDVQLAMTELYESSLGGE
ncbi:TPA: hypothetical protein QFK61_002090 [Enterococcus faecium]|jgi:hypothetical protein|nr:hypothetical protein [Enterococcus faecium]MDQ8303967.1 hypothetical protein [Enterococcus faecium]MDQ8427414.1 hypothetical protein [Enterococcus faecium]NTK37766.1 hypothetical protein [Enterococcus faecium]